MVPSSEEPAPAQELGRRVFLVLLRAVGPEHTSLAKVCNPYVSTQTLNKDTLSEMKRKTGKRAWGLGGADVLSSELLRTVLCSGCGSSRSFVPHEVLYK